MSDTEKLERLAQARVKAAEVRAKMSTMSTEEKEKFKADRDAEKKQKAKEKYAAKKAEIAALKEAATKNNTEPMKIDKIDKKAPLKGKSGPAPIELKVEPEPEPPKTEPEPPKPPESPKPPEPPKPPAPPKAPEPPKPRKKKVVIQQNSDSESEDDTPEIVYIKRKHIRTNPSKKKPAPPEQPAPQIMHQKGSHMPQSFRSRNYHFQPKEVNFPMYHNL